MTARPEQIAEPWATLAAGAELSAAELGEVLQAMELQRSRHVESHRRPAAHAELLAVRHGREDLRQRARLIQADITARGGALAAGATVMREVDAWAEQQHEPYIGSRANYLLAIVAQAGGDLPQVRIHGIRSVELLPPDAPRALLVECLIMLATGYEPGAAEAGRWNRQALDLAITLGDASKAIAVRNNMAWDACVSGEVEEASEHTDAMLAMSRQRGLPLKGVMVDTAARVQILRGEYERALQTLHGAVTESPDVLMTEPFALPVCLLAQAEAQRLLGRYDEAQQSIDRARDVAAEREAREVQAQVRRDQARLFAAQGRFERAYQEFVLFHEETEALQSQEREARARLAQVAFESEQARRDRTEFRELAMRDSLTGLYNRRFIETQLQHLATRAAELSLPLSVGIIDCDFFKRINDELSHEVGDRVLAELARTFRLTVVAPETVGRLGGEEFIVALPDLDAAAAWQRCEQIRHAVHSFDWSPLTGDLPVTVSVGVSTAAGGHTTPNALLSDADRNLYAAKRSGRNRVMGDPAVG